MTAPLNLMYCSKRLFSLTTLAAEFPQRTGGFFLHNETELMTAKTIGAVLCIGASLLAMLLNSLDANAGGTIKPNPAYYRFQQGATITAQPSETACLELTRSRTTNPGNATQTFQLKSGSGGLLYTGASTWELLQQANERLIAQSQNLTSGSNVLALTRTTKFAASGPSCVETYNLITTFNSRPMQPAVIAGIDPPTTQPPTRVTGLRWTAPTRNSNGSALTDLAGYRIVYGETLDALASTIQLSSPSVTQYTLPESFPRGRQFVAIKAYTTAGTESDLSNIITVGEP